MLSLCRCPLEAKAEAEADAKADAEPKVTGKASTPKQPKSGLGVWIGEFGGLIKFYTPNGLAFPPNYVNSHPQMC